MKINKLIIICIMQFLICCTNRNDIRFQSRELNYEPVHIALDKINSEPICVDSLVKNVFYIKPEASENSLISQYDKILVCGDTLFILEKSNIQQKVFAFNINGDFLFSVDGRGKGPGEYRNISDFYIDCDNKYIGILDYSKILKYDFTGAYLGAVDLSKYNTGDIIYANNTISAHTRPTDYLSKFCFGFALFSSDGELIYRDYPESRAMLNFSFHKQNYFSANSSVVLFNPLKCDTIYEVGDKHLIPKFVLDFGKYRLPDDVAKNIIASDDASALIKSNYNHFGLSSISATNSYIVFQYIINKTVHIALYSIQTNSIIYCSYFSNCNSYLNTISGMKKFDNNRFYSITNISMAIWHKKSDEFLGILDEPSKFDEHRLKRYEAIKDLTPNDNDVITVFELKDF